MLPKKYFLLMIAISVTSCGGDSGEESTPASSGKITGKLVNINSFSNVSISVLNSSSSSALVSSQAVATTRPDSSGRFEAGVPPGCYQLEITEPNHRSRAIENVCVDRNNPTNNLGDIGLSVERRFVMTASIGKLVFMAGGYNANSMYSTVDILDVTTGKMDVKHLSKRRARGAGASIGQLAIFAGGEECDSEGYTSCRISDLVDIYNVSTGTWSSTNLTVPRVDIASAVTSDGYVLFAGGSAQTAASDRIDIYDSNTGLWTTATLPTARFGISAIAVGTKVFFAGGSGPNNSGAIKTTRIDIYEPSTGIWTLKNLSVARRYFPTVQIGRKLFFAGGQTDCFPCGVESVVDIFDLDTEVWSTAQLSKGRELLVAESNGSVGVFVGGEDSNTGGETNVVDIYDSQTDTWTSATISQSRTNISVARNGNKAYFIGGNFGSNSFSNKIDVFDFSTKTFSTSSF